MALVTTKEMFKKAYEGHYAIGAFNINNMEIIQAITEAAAEERSPVILQVSAGARKYAKHVYLMALAKAAIEDSGIDLALHLDHGADFDICKSCIDGGFSSVMIDGSHHPYEENVALTRKVVEYAHAHGVVVEGIKENICILFCSSSERPASSNVSSDLSYFFLRSSITGSSSSS